MFSAITRNSFGRAFKTARPIFICVRIVHSTFSKSMIVTKKLQGAFKKILGGLVFHDSDLPHRSFSEFDNRSDF